MRTDNHNNPTAMTTDIAKLGGLRDGIEYAPGAPFQDGASIYHTAKLIGDPVALTIRVIDEIGFYTSHGGMRWVYLALPKFLWNELNPLEKRDIVGFMYQREGGTAMRDLFPRFGER